MLKLRRTRRAIAMSAATLALATGAAVGSAGTAQASSSIWYDLYNYQLASMYDGTCLKLTPSWPREIPAWLAPVGWTV